MKKVELSGVIITWVHNGLCINRKGGKMTGLFTLFRFSRYQSKLFPTTDLQVPELVTQKAGHFTPPPLIPRLFLSTKLKNLLHFYVKIHMCAYTLIRSAGIMEECGSKCSQKIFELTEEKKKKRKI